LRQAVKLNKYSMSKSIRCAFRILALCYLVVFDVFSQSKADFKNPPNEFKPMPFWHINGELTTEGIRQQMKDAKELAGFSGVSVLPLAPRKNGKSGTLPKFLTDDYLDRFQDVLDAAEELNMQVILYDDNDFPTGMAGGKLGELFPEHTMKRLDKIELEVQGPLAYSDTVPSGKLMAVVAMNTRSLERLELSDFVKDGKLNWEVPAGEWKIMFFVSVKDSWHKAYPVVDYLDTTAVRHMINLTYDKYAEEFGKYFGNIIQMTFFDDVGFWRHPRTWTGLFNEKFEELYGYDPKPYYPALWYDIGPDTESFAMPFLTHGRNCWQRVFPNLLVNGTKNTG
jgi:hypothetical protein